MEKRKMGIRDNQIVKNASWIIVCRVFQSLISFVIGMISARYLGPSNYGLINYASSIIAFVVPLAQLGLRNVLVEEIISHPEREGKTLGTSLVMSSCMSLLCIVGCLAFVSIVNAGETDTLIVCALYSISLVFQMTEMIQYWYQAKLLRSRYYIVSGMMVTVFSQTDKIMIKTMIDDSANGYYSAAITCAAMTGFVFSALIDSMRPVVFESNKISDERFEKNMARLYSLIIYMGLAQSIVLTLLADPIISVLYGKDYLPSIPLLQIITWYSAFSYMGSVRNIWMLAKEKQKYLWLINLMGAALNVAGNFALIPVLGASGAAIASVATQFFTNFILCLIFKPIKPTTRLIVRALNPKTIIEMIPRKENKNVK